MCIKRMDMPAKLKIELNELLDNAQLQTKADGERESNGQGS